METDRNGHLAAVIVISFHTFRNIVLLFAVCILHYVFGRVCFVLSVEHEPVFETPPYFTSQNGLLRDLSRALQVDCVY